MLWNFNWEVVEVVLTTQPLPRLKSNNTSAHWVWKGNREHSLRHGLGRSRAQPPVSGNVMRYRCCCCPCEYCLGSHGRGRRCPSAYDYTVPPMEKALVKTDIQIALPAGCYGRVAPRSGLAAKHFIDVGVKKGDRIAQLICERIYYPEIEEVQGLDDTERGAGGFGSTGKN
ncbi:deoxyuridine 5'-triphosphate nucleotidohydrolase, mitochondrial isoform X2 [Phyllostomus discolor]|uniref:Deoxyuridine 5'-triphosphate nucleotidohydrolase n=1 Tax=Phyllostomus discolor TaxID=89673 RepID=A0A7E6ECS9_9CHIR|nr:deoxyuridine 5'-triphosphate nucleotidohydrolase, mitochondrial isoform X2 [Phyllostomus discolor]